MEQPKIWLMSDPHFGHKNILKFEESRRRYADTDEMDNGIITNYNNTVGENDIVFILGDMFFCNSKRMDYIAGRMEKGRKILIRGNHDKGVSDSKFRRLGFDPHRIYQYEMFVLTHEPISASNMAYLNHHGIMGNIHGHTHGVETGLDPAKWQCVSVEKTDYKPISYIDVLNRFVEGGA